jgi:hypothetical protein
MSLAALAALVQDRSECLMFILRFQTLSLHETAFGLIVRKLSVRVVAAALSFVP